MEAHEKDTQDLVGGSLPRQRIVAAHRQQPEVMPDHFRILLVDIPLVAVAAHMTYCSHPVVVDKGLGSVPLGPGDRLERNWHLVQSRMLDLHNGVSFDRLHRRLVVEQKSDPHIRVDCCRIVLIGLDHDLAAQTKGAQAAVLSSALLLSFSERCSTERGLLLIFRGYEPTKGS